MTAIEDIQATKYVSKDMNIISFQKRNDIITTLWKQLWLCIDRIKEENTKDLLMMDICDPMYDRLLLTDARILSMIQWCKILASMDDPLKKYDMEKGFITKEWLHIQKIGVPLWVVACIYESRPNVTIDIVTMCIKSGNAVILRGWKEARHTNKILVDIAKDVLQRYNLDERVICNFPLDRKYLKYLYNAVWLIDVIIPRWWKWLIDSVRKYSHIPVIETWAGVVHIYLDDDIGNMQERAVEIIANAKLSRPSVCNALDTLIINTWLGDNRIRDILRNLQNQWIKIITTGQDYSKEHLSSDLNIKYVHDIKGAMQHIEEFSSKHSDCIITENNDKAELFFKMINSSVVYLNTSTRFSDGYCFGYWWEIWISTQKLHARWPMWAQSLVTYKYRVESDYCIRK